MSDNWMPVGSLASSSRSGPEPTTPTGQCGSLPMDDNDISPGPSIPRRSPRHQAMCDKAARRSPPPAPRAPGRTYRLSEQQRQLPEMSGLARRLNFGAREVEREADANAQSSAVLARRRVRKVSKGWDGPIQGNGKERRGQHMPLLSLEMQEADTSHQALSARRTLGSPVHLLPQGSNLTEPDEEVNVGQSRRRTGSRRKRSLSNSSEGVAPVSELDRRVPSQDSFEGPRRQQPKRLCNTVKHLPNSFKGSSSRSSTPSIPSPLATASMHRSISASGAEASENRMPTRLLLLRTTNANQGQAGKVGLGMSRSISTASYLVRTPAEMKKSGRVVELDGDRSQLNSRQGRYRRHQRGSSSCSSPFIAAQNGPTTTSVAPSDYFGSWAIGSPLAEAR